MFGSEFGQLDIEDYALNPFFAIRPKVYAGLGVEYVNKDGIVVMSKDKMRMKGVSSNSTIIKDEQIVKKINNDFALKRELHEVDSRRPSSAIKD
jgi:hypothetical protein